MRVQKVEKSMIQGRIDPSAHNWIKEEAAKQERSVAWMLNRVITDAQRASEGRKEVQQ